MANTFPQILDQLRQQAQPHVVNVMLTIHSENRNVFYGYGGLLYSQTRPLRPARFFVDVLSSKYPTSGNDSVKFLNNISYSVDPNLRGSWGENQTFLVQEAAVEYWIVSIESLFYVGPILPGVSLPPPSLSISMASYRPQRGTFSVDLNSQGLFLTGMGESPFDPSVRASYVMSFGEISPYTEIR